MEDKKQSGFGDNGPSLNSFPRSAAAVFSGSRPAKLRDFWGLLARLESLSALEASLAVGDMNQFDRIQDEKASVFAMLHVLGRSLGLDRSNKDLRVRLEALERAERRNLAKISIILEGIGVELRESVASQRNLHSLRGAYLAESHGGAFFAEG
jgi:hypothetical protein